MIAGIAAAVLLAGVALGSLPRTVYSAGYSEKETEPQATEARLMTEDSTLTLELPEATEPVAAEPEVTEPEVTEPEVTEPEVVEVQEPAGELPTAPENTDMTPEELNGAYMVVRTINEDVRMAVLEVEDFLDMTNSRKGQPWDEGWICPLTRETYVSSPFGYRWHPVYGTYRMHNGVDLNSDWYHDIVAPRSGTVIARGYSSSAGYYVKIDHGNGLVSEYFHLADYFVSVGQYVAQGELIALVGSTGTSTGAHLHFGMLLDGVYVDPEDYIEFS